MPFKNPSFAEDRLKEEKKLPRQIQRFIGKMLLHANIIIFPTRSNQSVIGILTVSAGMFPHSSSRIFGAAEEWRRISNETCCKVAFLRWLFTTHLLRRSTLRTRPCCRTCCRWSGRSPLCKARIRQGWKRRPRWGARPCTAQGTGGDDTPL